MGADNPGTTTESNQMASGTVGAEYLGTIPEPKRIGARMRSGPVGAEYLGTILELKRIGSPAGYVKLDPGAMEAELVVEMETLPEHEPIPWATTTPGLRPRPCKEISQAPCLFSGEKPYHGPSVYPYKQFVLVEELSCDPNLCPTESCPQGP